MKKADFDAKAQEMGDFYMYYQKEGRTVYSVCTADLSTPYIKTHKRMKRKQAHNPFTEVAVWSWQADRLITVNLEDVRRLVPLSSILKNHG